MCTLSIIQHSSLLESHGSCFLDFESRVSQVSTPGLAVSTSPLFVDLSQGYQCTIFASPFCKRQLKHLDPPGPQSTVEHHRAHATGSGAPWWLKELPNISVVLAAIVFETLTSLVYGSVAFQAAQNDASYSSPLVSDINAMVGWFNLGRLR